MNVYTENLLFFSALLGLAWCVMNAFIAGEKGRSVFGTLVLSLLLTPLLGWMYIVAVPPLAPRAKV